MREARLTGSPITVKSIRFGEPILPAMTLPVAMPMPMRISLARERQAEDRHDRIADIFVDDAGAVAEDILHIGEIFVEHGDGAGGAERLGERGEAAYVGEQRRRDLRRAAERLARILDQPIDDLVREIARHGAPQLALALEIL